MRPKYEEIFLFSRSRAFLLPALMENSTVLQLWSFLVVCPIWKTVKLPGKKLQNATKVDLSIL
jgi:hypothetical protein